MVTSRKIFFANKRAAKTLGLVNRVLVALLASFVVASALSESLNRPRLTSQPGIWSGSQTVLPPRNAASFVKCAAYFGGGGAGRSELNISTAQSHLPSGCLRTTVTNLPASLTGPGAPAGVIVIV